MNEPLDESDITLLELIWTKGCFAPISDKEAADLFERGLIEPIGAASWRIEPDGINAVREWKKNHDQ